MASEKPTLLIVEDDLDVAEMLSSYFRVQEYEVILAHWGEEAVRKAQEGEISLMILDIRLPDVDGFEVAKRLRDARKTQDLPIIFLTEKRERVDRLRGLALRAEDYITKPFDVIELSLKVRNVLQRSRRGSLTNTITGLPEGAVVEERLNECLSQAAWSILVVSIDHVVNFREVYGFVASDDLLRAVGIMLQDALREAGGDSFLGQLTAFDFLMVCSPASAPSLKERIHRRLLQSFDFFYSEKDRPHMAASGSRLAVRIGELTPAASKARTAAELRAEIEHLYRQGQK